MGKLKFDAEFYNRIYLDLIDNMPYMEEEIESWRPRSDFSIKVITKSGDVYTYNINDKTLSTTRVAPKIEDNINDENCRQSFAYHLKDLMKTKGYNQRTLSEHTGISSAAINGYLRATKTPTLTSLKKIAYVLECSISELID